MSALSERVRAALAAEGLRCAARAGERRLGTVFLARQVTLDRPVAVKVRAPSSHGTGADQFVREARTLASLSHPNIVRCTTSGSRLDSSFM